MVLEFIIQNIGTILVTLGLIAIVSAIVRKLIRDKKAGKSSCGCDCSRCGMCGSCHQK